MARGTPETVSNGGLTTKQHRNRPMMIVNQGEGKEKSTTVFGLALRDWSQGWSIGVFQFMKSTKWRIGEQTALETLGKLHKETDQGGAVEWHKMGSGWSWTRKTSRGDPIRVARDDWEEVKRRLTEQTRGLYVLDEFTYPIEWGWVDVDEVVETLANRPGFQHIIITGCRYPKPVLELVNLVTNMTKIKHPFDEGQKDQKGVEW